MEQLRFTGGMKLQIISSPESQVFFKSLVIIHEREKKPELFYIFQTSYVYLFL